MSIILESSKEISNKNQSFSSMCAFDKWGIGILSFFSLAKGNRKFIIVSIDYFTKLIEAKPSTIITTDKATSFI